MASLFSPLRIRDLTIKNRIFMAPMCQYSAVDGIASDWHLVHLGGRAVGGAGLIIVEATAVSPEGRISHGDLGLWSPAQVERLKPICKFISEQGCVPAIQIAHAGRKAAIPVAWLPKETQIPWETVAPSAIAFSKDYRAPRELTVSELDLIADQFSQSARYSLEAGFRVVEIHMAHGYLLNEFLSPISNRRTDNFGGSLENRMRFPLRVAERIRNEWPASLPVFVRISATEWDETGWTIADSVIFAQKLKALGIDLIDCSSGGNLDGAKIPVAPGYQVPLATTIKREVGLLTGAVGLITEAHQAHEILTNENADVILLGRELLRNPYWVLQAAAKLGVELKWPPQYERGKP